MSEAKKRLLHAVDAAVRQYADDVRDTKIEARVDSLRDGDMDALYAAQMVLIALRGVPEAKALIKATGLSTRRYLTPGCKPEEAIRWLTELAERHKKSP